MSDWKRWDDEKPASGVKVAILFSDGSGARTALIVDGATECGGIDVLDCEDAMPMSAGLLSGALWTCVPDDYELWFEAHP